MRSRNWRLAAAGVVVVAATLGLAVFFYLKGSPLKELASLKMAAGLGSTPPYEQPLELPDAVVRIDHGCYVALFRLGVGAEDVHFERVERLRKDGREWDQAQVRVELPRSVPFEAAHAELARQLEPLGERLELLWEPRGKRGCLELRWDGLLTHRLDLRRPAAAPRPRVVAERPRVALVMDDLGYDLRQAEHLLGLEAPIACSVLPRSPHGREIARLASGAGFECLVHLPMEATGLPLRKLGEGALLMDMDAGQLLRTLREDLDELPQATGVNNHMGSLLTANEPRMKVVLGEIKRRGLFFLDSRTTGRSLGYPLAQRMGVKAADRSIFLDTVQDKEAILAQMAKLASVARSQGQAVAICHPYPATFAALEEGLPQLRQKVQLVRVSALAR